MSPGTVRRIFLRILSLFLVLVRCLRPRGFFLFFFFFFFLLSLSLSLTFSPDFSQTPLLSLSKASAPNGTVVLVHGFGASSGHFRKNVPAIAKAGYRVLAPDVIGFGASAKPLDNEGKPAVEYSTALWRDFVVDFVAEIARGGESESGNSSSSKVVLVGNSLGSLVALRAAAELPSGQPPISGIALLNLAGGMNNKAASSGDSDWRLVLARPLFALIDFLLSIRPVAAKLFDSFRSPESLKNVLSSVYVNQDAVDDALVELIAGPAREPGALEAFIAIITGDPGPRPEQILEKLPATTPLLFIWGTKDVFTPVDGPVGTWAIKLPETRPATQFELIEGVGHCLHDEFEELVHERLLPWLGKTMPVSS
jgi:pimeloyl-ACP methyl ester carboxylesterase